MLKAPRRAVLYAALACAATLLSLAATARAQTNVPVMSADDRVLGKADAPITIFEYASLTCPHCAAFDVQTLPTVKTDWIDTGKAKLIFRDYPLDKLALSAATIVRCAPADRFYGFIDALYHDQAEWGLMADPNQAQPIIARLGGLSKEQADTCAANTYITNFILGERLSANGQFGVNATPTFFINGHKIVGELAYPDFAKELEAALPKP